MVSRSARRRPPLCVAARRALIFEGWVRGPEFTHTDHAVDIDNGLGWTIIVVTAGHRHYGGVVAPPARGLDGARIPLWPYRADTGVAGAFRRSQPGVQRGHREQNSGDVDALSLPRAPVSQWNALRCIITASLACAMTQCDEGDRGGPTLDRLPEVGSRTPWSSTRKVRVLRAWPNKSKVRSC